MTTVPLVRLLSLSRGTLRILSQSIFMQGVQSCCRFTSQSRFSSLIVFAASLARFRIRTEASLPTPYCKGNTIIRSTLASYFGACCGKSLLSLWSTRTSWTRAEDDTKAVTIKPRWWRFWRPVGFLFIFSGRSRLLYHVSNEHGQQRRDPRSNYGTARRHELILP